MRARWKWLLGLVLLVAVIAISATQLRGMWGDALAVPTQKLRLMWFGDPSKRYRQAEVKRGDLEFVVNSTGTVQPVRRVQIGVFVSGPIVEALADFNSEVKEGDVLAKIDPRIYESNVARDMATLAHRKADKARIEALLLLATNNYDRALNLREAKKTYLSDQELDQFKAEKGSLAAQLETSKAAIAEAEATLKVSKQNLDYTIIRAPVDGVVIDRQIDPGQTVAASFQTPTLFIIAPDLRERVYVYASVDEADIGLIRMAKERSAPAHFTVDAYDDLFAGKVTQIRLNPTTTQNVVTYTVVVEAANHELKLLPGMTASLSFQIENREDVLKVPNAALRFFPRVEQVHPQYKPLVEGKVVLAAETESTAIKPSAKEKASAARERNRRHVWVIEGELLAAKEVVTGISDSSFTELVEGDLKPDEKVVTGTQSAFGR